MITDDNDTTFTFRVDSKLKQVAEVVAKKNDVKLAYILRQALRDYLEKYPEITAEVRKSLEKQHK